MSLATPTTQAVSDNIVAQIEAALSQTIPLLPKAFTRVLAKALGGVLVLVWKYAGFMLLQMFVAFATMEETEVNGKKIRPLVEWGRLFGVGDPNAGQRAELVIDVSVSNQTGSLPGGTQLLRAETGVLYQTVAAVPLDADTIQVTVVASSDQEGNGGVGAIGNLDVGAELSFANPPSNVAETAIVVSTSVVGANAETLDAYRARITRRVQGKPQGGAYADYRMWGEEVPGVANVYPYTGNRPGEVDVYVEATTEEDPDGLPNEALIAAVVASINFDESGLANRRPANAAVNVLSIFRTEFTVVVGGLSAPNRSATQSSIEEGIDEYLRAREPYIEGLSVLPRRDSITQGAIGGIVNSIANAEGGTVTNVVLKRGGIAIPAYLLIQGEKSKLETDGVTYV